jgi:hypothetical protein
MGPSDVRRELVPVTAQVGRVGSPRRPSGRLARGRSNEDGPRRSRRPEQAVLAAAVLAAAAAVAVGVTSVGGGSQKRADVGAVREKTPPETTSTQRATSAADEKQTATTIETTPAKKRSQGTTSSATTQSASTQQTETVGRLAPAVSKPAPQKPTSAGVVPNSGYALAGTHLLVDSTGWKIKNFVVQARCARGATLPTIPIQRDGTFRFHGAIPSSPDTNAAVTGQFGAKRVKLTMHFTALSCESGFLRMRLPLS